MSRVLFRYFVYGVMLNFFLDILWVPGRWKTFAAADRVLYKEKRGKSAGRPVSL